MCQAHRLGLYNWPFWQYSLLTEVRNFGMPGLIPELKHIRLDFVVKVSVETIIGSELCQLLNVFKNKLSFINTDLMRDTSLVPNEIVLIKIRTLLWKQSNWQEQTSYMTFVKRTCSVCFTVCKMFLCYFDKHLLIAAVKWWWNSHSLLSYGQQV